MRIAGSIFNLGASSLGKSIRHLSATPAGGEGILCVDVFSDIN